MRNPLAVCGQLSPTTTVGHPHYAEAPLVQTGVAVCSADPCMANCRFALWSDEGHYLCSERTMYRILAADQPVRERRNQREHPQYAKPELVATAPNQTWSSASAPHNCSPISAYEPDETEVWVRTGRPVDDDARARHVEIAAFARSVEGDEVAFESCSRRRLLDTSLSAPDGTVRTHAQTVIERCSP